MDPNPTVDVNPSAVLHFKNVPKTVSKVWKSFPFYIQGDIQKVTDQFGPAELIVVLRPKEQVAVFGQTELQALVEMKSIDAAVRLYDFAKANQLVLSNNKISVSYSVHMHLQRNPLDYTPRHILLVTICGCSEIPFTLFEIAGVRFVERRDFMTSYVIVSIASSRYCFSIMKLDLRP